MNEATIQLRDKGVITLPMSLRRKYSLRTGDVFSVSDLGEERERDYREHYVNHAEARGAGQTRSE